MPTPLYRLALKAFWRRAENADVTITAATPDTYAGAVQRFPFPTGGNPGIVDQYFYEAGQALIRVLQGLTYDEIYKISPTLIVTETITLTVGVGAISSVNLAYTFDRQKVYTTGGGAIVAFAKVLDALDRDEVINNLNPRKKPAIDQPYFEVLGATVNVYPTTFTKIDLRFLKSCPMPIASDGADDIFPEGINDIWTDMAVRLAMGDLKDSMEATISKLLQEKYSFLARPKLVSPKTQEIAR